MANCEGLITNCDLSRDKVPNASRSNAERNGKRTGDERLGKPFETVLFIQIWKDIIITH